MAVGASTAWSCAATRSGEVRTSCRICSISASSSSPSCRAIASPSKVVRVRTSARSASSMSSSGSATRRSSPMAVAARCAAEQAAVEARGRSDMTAEAGERLVTAMRGLSSRVAQVRPEDLGRPTPCTEWDVRALLEHVIGELLWTEPLLAGKTIADVGARLEGDHVGSDAAAACAAGVAVAADAVIGVTDWSAPVHVSYGDVPAASYVAEVATDVLVHTWDVARAVGADEELDDELVQLALERLAGQEDMLAASGLFATPVPVPGDAPAQTRLLAALGRTP